MKPAGSTHRLSDSPGKLPLEDCDAAVLLRVLRCEPFEF